MNTKKKLRILVAAAPSASGAIESALGDEHEVVRAENLSQAKQQLENVIDMTVCDLYFDDSRMFDLLRRAKADESTRTMPFLAIKTSDGALSATLRQGVEIACAALGAEKFIDLAQWEQSYGRPAAHERLRALVAHALQAKP
ncbi:MAG TPA: hypothetical protein VIG66_00460 [Noviherbaspirillum sp.]